MTNLTNAWTTSQDIETTRQKIIEFLGQNNMKIVSSENDYFQAQQDVVLPGWENGPSGPVLDFQKRAAIQIRAVNGGTHVNVAIEDLTESTELTPEVKEQHDFLLKKWMWNIYSLLPPEQPPSPPSNPQAVHPQASTYTPTAGQGQPNPAQGTPAIQTYYPQGYIQQRPLKDKGTTMALEIVLDLFGLYGIGWLYSGNTTAGITWLVGGLIWAVIATTIAVFTGGFALLCTIPVNIVLTTISATNLNGYIKKHPEIFGV